jgi:hypothetical protein
MRDFPYPCGVRKMSTLTIAIPFQAVSKIV